MDRVQFLRENHRYNKAGLLGKGTLGNLQKEAGALQKAGYATYEDYAQKLAGIFNGPTMRRSIALAMAKETEMAPKLGSALHQGEHSPAIKELQRQLHSLGYTDVYSRSLEVDGRYGPSTKHAIETFQRDMPLQEVRYTLSWRILAGRPRPRLACVRMENPARQSRRLRAAATALWLVTDGPAAFAFQSPRRHALRQRTLRLMSRLSLGSKDWASPEYCMRGRALAHKILQRQHAEHLPYTGRASRALR